jgi:hypothetical protein
MGQVVLFLNLNAIDKLNVFGNQQIKAGKHLLSDRQAFSGMVIPQMDSVDFPVGGHAEGVDHFEEGGIVDFILNSLKAEQYPDVFFLGMEIVFVEKGDEVLGLEDGLAASEVLEEGEGVEEVEGGEDLLDAVDDLLAFGDGDEKRGEHLVDLQLGLSGHG